jgi:hypothetical protein
MSDFPEFPDHESREERELRLLSIAIDGVIAQTCRRHYGADTQEHQLTSRIAEALERELGTISIDGMPVQVNAQELSDKGRGSKERKVGADLYVSIVVKKRDTVISKGMLVQAKWDDTLGSSPDDIKRQCDDMLRRSKDSYVWVYGPGSVGVVPADTDFSDGGRRAVEGAQTVGELLASGVKCTAGDETIGRNTDRPLVDSLNDMLRELAARAAISIVAQRR